MMIIKKFFDKIIGRESPSKAYIEHLKNNNYVTDVIKEIDRHK